MLSVSPLRSSNCDEREEHVGGFSTTASDDFSDDYSGGSTLLEDIDFDDLFVGFDDRDLLPDLELDPAEILAEFSVGSDEQEAATHLTVDHDQVVQEAKPREAKGLISSDDTRSSKSREKDWPAKSPTTSSSSSEVIGGRKSSALSAKGSHGKRKLKVDWTPELHRRFVQAVEQLGVDKAVPSRILELMGIDCLTRHNIASHLQKYRSHRKHMLAREAEAATWSQKRHIYAGGGAGLAKKEVNLHPWLPLPPSMGFPPTPITAFRPLHVWGHPTVDQSMLHMWPKHLVRSPPPPWVPQLPLPPDPSYWHQHYTRGHRERWVPNALTQGTPCFPQPARFQAPPVPGVPQPPMIRPNYGVPPSSNHSSTQIHLDSHQSKENIDAAIGDVLAKPWLPLPLGLKPPSLDSVLVELQRQGVSKIPPACA